MSMSHKAYAFDWRGFERDELYRILLAALESETPQPLPGTSTLSAKRSATRMRAGGSGRVGRKLWRTGTCTSTATSR